MTLTEAAKELGLHPGTLRTQIKLGNLTATKLARDWFVTRAEVERYRREHRRQVATIAEVAKSA